MIALEQTTDEHRRDTILTRGSLVLTAISAILLVVGLTQASLELSDYGLVDTFPIIFYVGLALLPIASAVLWFTRRRIDVIVVGQLLMLIAALWLSPYLIEETVRFRSGYKNFAAVDWLISGDGFNPDVVIYHNWPLFPSVMAGVLKITSLEPTQLMGIFPFLISVAYLIPLVMLLRIFSGSDNRWWAGVWFFYLFNWTGQDYFSPQAFAFLLFLMLMVVLAHIASRRDGQFGAPLMAGALGVYGAIVLTHLLTSVIAFAIIMVLTLLGRLKQPSILVAAFVIFAAWQLYGAHSWFDINSERQLNNLFDPDSFLSLNVENRLTGTPGHVFVGQLRTLTTLVAFSLGGLGLLVWVKDLKIGRLAVRFSRGLEQHFELERKSTSQGIALSSQPVMFALPALLGLAIVAPMFVYGGEMLIRVMLFSLPAVALLFAIAMSWRIAVLPIIAVLALAAPLHVVTHYGNESYDYVSPGELEGFDFVSNQLGPANVFGGYPAASFEGTKGLEWRSAVKPAKGDMPSLDGYLRPDEFRWLNDDRPIYIALSRGDEAAAHLFYDRSGFLEEVRAELDSRCNYRLVFHNEDFAVYRWYSECQENNASSSPLDDNQFSDGGAFFP